MCVAIRTRPRYFGRGFGASVISLPIDRPMRTPICLASMGLASLLAVGACTTRAAEKLIDPRLRETGELLEREGRGQTLVLGPYRVAGLERQEAPPDLGGGFGAAAMGSDERTRPSHLLSLDFGLTGGPRAWRVSCQGQRRQPADHDFAAVADEQRDEVAMRCTLEAEREGGEPEIWTLSLAGTLADNILGELVGPGPTSEAPTRAIELLMWHRVWNISRRHLPASLVEVRSLDGRQTDAALIMAPREQAMLDAALEPGERALVMATMLAIRLMPLGFDL